MFRRKRRQRLEEAPAPTAPIMPTTFRLATWAKVVAGLCAIGAIVALVAPPIIRAVNYRPTIAERAMREARTIWLTHILSYSCTGTLVLLGIAAVASLWLGVRWIRALIAQQEEVRAHDGVFPVIVRKTWTWRRVGRWAFPTQILAVVDLNKNPAPILVINSPDPTPQFELPESIPADQRAVTHGAQVVQATAASRGGAPQPQLATFLDQVPQLPTSLIDGDPPDIKYLPSKHVYQLLDEAGLLEPDERIPE